MILLTTGELSELATDLCFNRHMTESELHRLVLEKWHLTGKPVRTLDDARAFIESVGIQPSVSACGRRCWSPTFVGAW